MKDSTAHSSLALLALLLSACGGDAGPNDQPLPAPTAGSGSTVATGGSSTGGIASVAGTGGTTPLGGSAGSGPTGGAATAEAGTAGTATNGGAGSGGAGSGGGASGGTASGGNTSGGNASGGSAGAGTGGNSSGVSGLVGFATLNGGTKGGQGGATVTANSYAQLQMYAESSTPYVIMISGTISNGANGGRINVKSNKSLIGVGSSAFLNGVGLNIANANDIIVQNLRVSLIGVTTRTDTPGVYSSTGDGGLPQILVNGGDAISISGTAKNIWIDHCELFSEDPNVQTNKDLYDGLIDIKGETGFITVSWCYLHDHHKGGLVGASDTDLFADRKVTLHHNYYNKVHLRVPMYRGATGHFFNNYVVGATDASEIRANTCVRLEKNYYESLHYSIYTSSDSVGKAERIDNIEVMHASRAYPADCKADIPYTYAQALTTTTTNVKTVVPAGAGVGKL